MRHFARSPFLRLAWRRAIRTARHITLVLLVLILIVISFGQLAGWEADVGSVEGSTGQKAEPEPDCKRRPLFSNRTSRSPSCQIPTLDPFNDCMLKHAEPLKEIVCRKEGVHFSFKLDFTFPDQVLLVQNSGDLASLCCYTAFSYKKEYDYKRLPSNESCRELNSTLSTVIPPDVEYIHLTCSKSRNNSTERVYEEYFHLVRRKPDFEPKKSHEGSYKPSVVVIGLDTQSRMNFARHMPGSQAFLTQRLGAIDMAGFTKVGDATFNNTLAYLMGLSFSDLVATCWNSTEAFFDACPFIWNQFAEQGYATSFAEEWNGVFDYRFKGFRKQPTDHYLHPFQHELDLNTGYATKSGMCFGPKFRFEVLMNNIEQMAMAYRDSPYFQFAWSSSLNIGTMSGPLLTDAFLEKTLLFLSNNKLLDNTILVLISDHGFRTGPVMYEYQGRVENRMPLAYFVLPEQFKKKYPDAVKSMLANQNRLATPYDVFQTLVDLSELSSISSESVLESRNLRLGFPKNRGTSLFLPIPLNRTCAEAGIDEQWCICNPYALISYTEPCPIVNQLAEVIVSTLNSWLTGFPKCAHFSLSHVIQAEVLVTENNPPADLSCLDIMSSSNFQTFRIILSVLPSRAEFEAVVFKDHATGSVKMSTEIARINAYGNDAACISEYKMKKICYCTPIPQKKRHIKYRKNRGRKIRDLRTARL